MKKIVLTGIIISILLTFTSCYFVDFFFDEIPPKTNESSNNTEDGKEEFLKNHKEDFLRIQSDVYDMMKQYIYDRLDSSMSYSTVQATMDNAEKQIKTKISTFSISLNLEDGTMSPKWICYVRLNDGNTYPLMYIKIDLNSTYHLTHKYIGTYKLKY